MSESELSIKVIAERMEAFNKEGRRLKDLCGKISGVEELSLMKANEQIVVESSSLSDISGVSFFTLGPVYVSAQVPYSFLDQYAAEMHPDTTFLTMELERDVLKGMDVYDGDIRVGTWNNIIHAIPTEELDQFTEFMVTQMLTRTDPEIGKCDIYGISRHDLIVQDPVKACSKQLTVTNPCMQDSIRLHVFTVFSRLLQLIPYIGLDSAVNFTTRPTTEKMKAEVESVMKTKAAEIGAG
jgi:hypothetical protein